jgi:hypothetical protein
MFIASKGLALVILKIPTPKRTETPQHTEDDTGKIHRWKTKQNQALELLLNNS